jgi:hypothetical protein
MHSLQFPTVLKQLEQLYSEIIVSIHYFYALLVDKEWKVLSVTGHPLKPSVLENTASVHAPTCLVLPRARINFILICNGQHRK